MFRAFLIGNWTLKEVSDVTSTYVYSSRETSKFWGESRWNGSVVHSILHSRLTKWFLIHWSIPVSFVYSLFISTKSFKRENISRLFPSSFQIHRPNFPITAFALSLSTNMLVSCPCIRGFSVLNFPKISHASLETKCSLRNVQHVLRFSSSKNSATLSRKMKEGVTTFRLDSQRELQ
jgi:hypothetical protein